MEKPEYVSEMAACAVNVGLAFAIFTVGAWVFCGWLIVIGT